jgi:pimeloyl-ACP methyl ester carboxylesterase
MTASYLNKPAGPVLASERERTLALPDGRTLSYTFHGAAEGPLVVVLDGPGSRGLARAASKIAAELGIRIVAPDRPGFFSSSPAPARGIADWPADHAALLDELGVERAGIVAQSGGTPYGLAAAVALPERVTGLAFIAPVGPLGDRENLADAGRQLRIGATLSRRAPWLFRRVLRAAGRKAAKDPDKAAASAAKDLPPGDAAVMQQPGNFDLHRQAMTEILSRPDAVAREIGLLARPWGIDLAACRVPVAFWSGDADVAHPTSHARRLAAAVGGAPVRVVPGAATFGLMPFYGDALTFATGR